MAVVPSGLSRCMNENPSHSPDFRVDVGRAEGNRTFVRVVHLPTGQSRSVVGLGGRAPDEVADDLALELLRQINSGRHGT
jgi:hypothetical protein